MRRWISRLAVAAAAFCASTAHADQASVDALTKLAKEGCLVGTQFDFKASAKGNLTFRDPTKPGGQGEVSTDIRNGSGAVAILDERIRVIADQQTRDCMHPFVIKIMNYIIEHPAPPETKTIRGVTVGSHAGDPRADGNDATACAIAEAGWTIVNGSGSLVPDGQPANGSIGITNTDYNTQHFCQTFHIVRADTGHSAQANAYVTAVETRPAH
ncbi:hypothetical protein B0G71_0064 [Paraburkholderia sp. BL27I4N3]|uniref:hypothetical protein n=1 Tax=Paraburkholderia sp. BL27I4N3 TaxID=1938805 RepID=UPI000E273611|nr:hypothetical protein [Paraburkholderia sp. BL27I4N3]REE17127.1 hypothetical protein B0G71_0064 [Paraburkholderia sp. BL27I4N3]